MDNEGGRWLVIKYDSKFPEVTFFSFDYLKKDTEEEFFDGYCSSFNVLQCADLRVRFLTRCLVVEIDLSGKTRLSLRRVVLLFCKNYDIEAILFKILNNCSNSLLVVVGGL